jgi:hypothetical protein
MNATLVKPAQDSSFHDTHAPSKDLVIRMQRQSLAMLVFFVTLVLFLNGCGGGALPGVKVTGSVTKAGKAQDGVAVAFIPTDGNTQSSRGARTDAEGKFELKLMPGNYAVTLVRMVDKKGNAPKESEDPSQDNTQLEASGYLSNAYDVKLSDPASTPIKVEIPAGGKELAPFEVK